MAQERNGEANSDNQGYPPLREAIDAVQRMYGNDALLLHFCQKTHSSYLKYSSSEERISIP